MKIVKGSFKVFTQVGMEGRVEFLLGPTLGDTERPEYATIPDDWVIMAYPKKGLSVGSSRGFLYLSPKGYSACKDKIKADLEERFPEPGIYGRKAWESYDAKMRAIYARMERATRNRIAFHKKKARQLREALENF